MSGDTATLREAAGHDAGRKASPAGDPRRSLGLVLRELASGADGLSSREAARRLVVHGPNELERRGSRSWPKELGRQLTHPLALLLWSAAALALASGSDVVAIAVIIVILLNAGLAFIQEQQAERSVEALRRYLPQQATVLRDGSRAVIDARLLVPGDVLIVGEGDRISADARLLSGSLEVDTSSINGESLPAYREASAAAESGPLLESPNLVFSGTSCTGGDARALVFATGMQTELGRIAALSQRAEREESPLERGVRKVAWLIAAVAIAIGGAFVPLGILAGLSLAGSVSFAIGLLLGNVPEGLLPTITLALAIGVRRLAARGALVKRLSAVETLGSTTVVVTDRTGTLTENRMQATMIWTAADSYELDRDQGFAEPTAASNDAALRAIAVAVSACNNAELGDPKDSGDPTEIALLHVARLLGQDTSRRRRDARRRRQFHFNPRIKMMSTIDEEAPGCLVVNAKGAPETLIDRCVGIRNRRSVVPLDAVARAEVDRIVDAAAARGLRVLAIGQRALAAGASCPQEREQAETELVLVGLVAIFDPPRREVAAAVSRCRRAGVRIIVVTGDHGLTASAIARAVGIVGGHPTVVTGADLDLLGESELDALLRDTPELIIARASREAKLRIADALRAEGQVVAMTATASTTRPHCAAPISGSRWVSPAPTWRARQRPWCSPMTTSRRSWLPSRKAAGSLRTSASSSSTSSSTPCRRLVRCSHSRSRAERSRSR